MSEEQTQTELCCFLFLLFFKTNPLCKLRKDKKGLFLDSSFFGGKADFLLSCLLPPLSTMPDTNLCLEALSALSGCNVEQTSSPSQLTPQDFVNIVALKEFYKQEGFKELEYPSLGTLSLQDLDEQDMYSSPLALTEGPGPEESLKTTVKINPQDFFHPQYNYDFTNIKVR